MFYLNHIIKMKRFKLWGAITLVIAMVIAVLSTTSCSRHQVDKSGIDSTELFKILNKIDNPEFNTEDEAILYLQNEKQWRYQDSVFFTLNEGVIHNICSVLTKRKIPITKSNITDEYLDNKRVYANLPQPSQDMYKAIDVPNTIEKDTIIDGKKMKIIESESKVEIHD